MNRSEFQKALEKVYGSALGLSLAQDLYLPQVRATAQEALDADVKPLEVWKALTEETGREDETWAHRQPVHRKRNS